MPHSFPDTLLSIGWDILWSTCTQNWSICVRPLRIYERQCKL